ncbi:MAG: hypothetical protein V4649_18565 [Bacteroidota bacterium]
MASDPQMIAFLDAYSTQIKKTTDLLLTSRQVQGDCAPALRSEYLKAKACTEALDERYRFMKSDSQMEH